LWNLALTWTGFALGERWERITDYTAPIEAALVVLVLLLVAWYVLKAIERRTEVLRKIGQSKAVQRNLRAVRRNVEHVREFSEEQALRLVGKGKKRKMRKRG
jgi:alpha-mannosidase